MIDSTTRPESAEGKPKDSEWEEVASEKAAGPNTAGNAGDAKAVISGEYAREYRETADVTPEGVEEIRTDYRPRARLGMLIVLITFLGFGGWAAVARLDGAALAQGEVLVDSQNRVIQHLDGGVVAEILIQDGTKVEMGDVLLRLSETRARADLEITESQLFETLGQEARLLAERSALDKVVFPEALTARADQAHVAAIIEGQEEVFDARRQSLSGRIAVFNQRIDALENQIQGMQSLSQNLSARAASYEEEVASWRDLYRRQLTDRLRINEMERELLRLKGEKDSTESEIARTRVKIGETRSELLVARQSYVEEVTTGLREAQERKADLMARRVSALETLERRDIRSPATGTVVGLKAHTVGAVIRPGDTIMEIVPNDNDFAIIARVRITDIDRVEVGQFADIRLSAFNFQAANVIEAKVVGVSADAYKDERTEEQYYEARLKVTDDGQQTMQGQNMYFRPGMPAEVMISTGERTALEYLLDPFSRLVERAFRES